MVSSRRVQSIGKNIARIIPEQGELRGLDIGCGSGEIAIVVQQTRLAKTTMVGVEIAPRDKTDIPVERFDGSTLPFENDAFDFAMIVDVLHHTENPAILLKEAVRVARVVVIKDHFCQSPFDHLCLTFMDWVGNRAYDIPLPNNYLSRDQWLTLFKECEIKLVEQKTDLQLYSGPLKGLFERGLHFVARVERA